MALEKDLSGSVAGVRALFGAAACSCALVDDEGSALTYVAADGEGCPGDPRGGAARSGGASPAGRPCPGQPIAVRDVRADPRFARDVAESTHYIPTALLAAPMFDAQGEVLGVLSVLDPTVDESSDWTLAVLGTLASQVAALVVAVRRAPAAAADASRLEALGRRVLEAVEDYER